MKKLALILSCLIALSAFAGFGALAETDPSAISGEIRVVWWGGDSRHEITLKVIDMFEAAYPNIKVSPEYMGADSYWDKLATQIAGGTAPDVIQFGGNYPDYVAKDALLELNGYMGNLLNIDNIDNDVIETGSRNGNLYSVCLGTNMLCLVYNKTMLEAAGCELPSNTMTWEELQAYCESIQPKLPDGVFAMADNSCNQTNYVTYYSRQMDAPIYLADGTSKMTAEIATQWIQMWEDFRAAGIIPDAETSASYAETAIDSSTMVAGKSAMCLIWTNQIGAYQGAMEDELALVQLPDNGVAAQWVQPSQYMCVNKKSENQDAAITFINFFVNDPEVGKVLGNDRGISCSTVVRDAQRAQATAADQQVYDFYAIATNRAIPMDPNLPNDQEFINTFKLILQNVAFAVKTPEQGGQEVYDLIQRMMAK